MAIKAIDSVTVYDFSDVENVRTWYITVPRTSSAPTVSPTATEAQMTSNGWSTTEPGVDTAKKLYTVQECIFGDGTYTWGDVSLSSSYEAAIQSYNLATAANQNASAASEAAEAANTAASTAASDLEAANGEIADLKERADSAESTLSVIAPEIERMVGMITLEPDLPTGPKLTVSAGQNKIVITENRISFIADDNEVAYMDQNKLYIKESEVKKVQRIGPFVWEVRGTNRVSLKYAPTS